jgi:hypothetical protein
LRFPTIASVFDFLSIAWKHSPFQKCAVSGKFSVPPSSSLVSITSKYKYSLRYGADDEILKEVAQRWISFKAIPCRGAL